MKIESIPFTARADIEEILFEYVFVCFYERESK